MKLMEHMTDSAFSNFGQNAGLVEEMYQSYLVDRSLVAESWARYFDTIGPVSNGIAATASVQNVNTSHVEKTSAHISQSVEVTPDKLLAQQKVFEVITAYRERGHLNSKLSPIESSYIPRPVAPDLSWDKYGFKSEDWDQEFLCLGLSGHQKMKLKDIRSILEAAYSSTLGTEFTHLHDAEERAWVQNKLEGRATSGSGLSGEEKIKILEGILYAEHFEDELHKKYIGHKRFSLEGGETLVPMLQYLIELGSEAGIKEAVIGMPHRGRLSVLVNVLQKPLLEILNEFEDQSIYSSLGSGDVKYHLGFESVYRSPNNNEVKLSLACNPSHLEVVNPVVEGICRAKQDLIYGGNHSAVLPVILHGDAACIGQGVVPETINFSRVNGYETGGSFHIIVNNQIGFTTYPEESRSCPYSSEMLKAVQAPIFHVNAEDPETCCWAVKTALEFRQRYQRDVVIDLYCYRKYGHNEADDPSYTQPVMYAEIKAKPKISVVYSDNLISQGVTSGDSVGEISRKYISNFDATYASRKKVPITEACALYGKINMPVEKTSASKETLEKIAKCFVKFEEGFTAHPKLVKILEARAEVIKEGKGIDWAFAEALAFGALLIDGVGVRLSGQDCIRGTFSHRHLGLRDYQSGNLSYPLRQLGEKASFEVYNSVLSEMAVMGFEFGYSTIAAKTLTMWEGQFGDFANGAQIVIDQFIAASESKWAQLSGLVLLLPHGYEGQGPEHSSARLERYLQLCAEGNMSVCVPTTAAQYFHLLRRQGLSALRRPLIVMTPKSLLRSPDAASLVSDLTSGSFKPVLPVRNLEAGKVKSVIFTSGKVCYDLSKALVEADNKHTEVVRLEELYPFPATELGSLLTTYSKASKFFWVQEEPRNMGAWTYAERQFRDDLKLELSYFGRPRSASTAAGSNKRHQLEQSLLVRDAVNFVKS